MSRKIILAFIMAGVTALAAQVKIPLPFTPVPLTGQVFAVLLSGIMLGSRFGAMSQLIYLTAGCAGLPVFAGLTFGPAVLLGPTGGYILGFIPAAYVAGKSLVVSRWPLATSITNDQRPTTNDCIRPNVIFVLLLMLIAILTIHLFGAVQFAYIMKTSFAETLHLAVYPFILIDLAKAVAVLAFAKRL